jgi:hypothetical protein
MRGKLFLAVKRLLYGYFAMLSSRQNIASETGQLENYELEGIWKEPAGGT